MRTTAAGSPAGGSIDSKVRLEQLAMLYTQLPLGLIVNVLNAALLAYILSDVVAAPLPALWFFAVVALSTVRAGSYWAYSKTSPSEYDYAFWRNLFAGGAFASAALWGMSGVLLFPVSSHAHQAFIGFVLAGMAAGAAGSMATHHKIFCAFLVLIIAPYMIRLLFAGTPINLAMSGMCLAFIAALSISAVRHTRMTIEALRLRFVNDELARDLERTIARHQDSNDALQLEVSKHQRTLDSLELALHDAEASVRAKAQFLANMSHEIRTPMNGVFGMTDLLMRTPLDPRQKKLVGTIKDSAQSLLTIINDILDLSRIEAGKLDLDIHEFNLRDMMERSVELFASQAQKKGIEISLFMDPGVMVFAKGDSGRIRQIVLNLIGNALKFTQHGEIRVRVTQISGAEGRPEVSISVADTGIGIARNVLAKLFQPFTQAETSISRRFGGTGLGLTIARHLADMMGGAITLDSEPGKGTTATIQLPLEQGNPTAIAQQSDLSVLDGARILVIDDRQTNRDIVTKYLEDSGCIVTAATSTTHAWSALTAAMASGKPYHAMIIDMLMPEENGLAFARRVKAHAELSPTKLVIATTFDWQGDAVTIRDAGVAAVLTKPIRRSDLTDVMAQAVQGARHAGWKASTSAASRTDQASDIQPQRAQLCASVLLVEDNAVNIEVAKEFLTSFGCIVATASNGLEALAALTSSTFDIVLMDCQMPVMDGLTATRRWRAIESETGRRPVPIMALTANAFAEDRNQCLLAGMNGYLRKPYSEDQLYVLLSTWLPKTAARNTSAPIADGTSCPTDAMRVTPLLDDAVLAPLRTKYPDLLVRIITTYLTHTPALLGELTTAAAEGDCVGMSRAAHSLKSSSANVGAVHLSDHCRALEETANANDVAASRTHALTITACFNEVERALQSERDSIHAAKTARSGVN